MEDDGNCCCECGLNLDNADDDGAIESGFMDRDMPVCSDCVLELANREFELCKFRGEEIKRLNKKLSGVNHELAESIKRLQSAYLHSE